MSGWVTVSGPPRSSWRRNSGTTEPVLPSTLPNRTVTQRIAAGRAARRDVERLAVHLGQPLAGAHHAGRVHRLVGRDEHHRRAPRPRAPRRPRWRVPTALVSRPSSGFASTIGTCFSAAAWNTSSGRTASNTARMRASSRMSAMHGLARHRADGSRPARGRSARARIRRCRAAPAAPARAPPPGAPAPSRSCRRRRSPARAAPAPAAPCPRGRAALAAGSAGPRSRPAQLDARPMRRRPGRAGSARGARRTGTPSRLGGLASSSASASPARSGSVTTSGRPAPALGAQPVAARRRPRRAPPRIGRPWMRRPVCRAPSAEQARARGTRRRGPRACQRAQEQVGVLAGADQQHRIGAGARIGGARAGRGGAGTAPAACRAATSSVSAWTIGKVGVGSGKRRRRPAAARTAPPLSTLLPPTAEQVARCRRSASIAAAGGTAARRAAGSRRHGEEPQRVQQAACGVRDPARQRRRDRGQRAVECDVEQDAVDRALRRHRPGLAPGPRAVQRGGLQCALRGGGGMAMQAALRPRSSAG